jgi:uncharacterized repeat protein (TIGR01451 family)
MKFRILLFTIFFYQITKCQIVNSFSPLISVTQKGDITHASNTILTCSGTGCAAAASQSPPGSGQPFPSGTAVANTASWNNNAYNMSYIDQDGAGIVAGINSFSSSNANLTLGTTGGCGVTYAVLTWGGNVIPSGAGATANYAKRDSVYLRVPGGTNYIGLKADSKIDNTSGATTYQCYKDVTNLVKAAGGGTYWAANVIANTGATNMCGGWSLVVLYSDPTLGLRNLVINKGYVNITNGSAPAGPQEFGLSGFSTPPSPAPVNIKLGAFSIEGDLGTIGDSLKFKGSGGSGNFEQVYNNLNHQNNFFNSSITIDGSGITRLPTQANSLGYDADIVTLDNATKKYLGNSANSATIRLTTAGDQYWVFLLTTAIDVFEPEIRLEKSFVNITNPGAPSAAPNDIIEFSIKASNKGSDPADSLIVIDSLYGGGIYVPGSMAVTSGQNSGTKTDDIGDDQMDFDPVANLVKARLGIGANGTQGGKLRNVNPADSITTFKFRVRISADCEIFKCSDTLFNMAFSTYKTQTSQDKRSQYTASFGTDPITGCPLSGPVKVKIDVNPICPPYSDTSISACNYNLSNILPKRPGFDTYFNSAGTQVTQATASGTYYAVRTLYKGFTWLPACKDSIVITYTNNCTLPVTFLDFTVNYKKEKSVSVDWVTTNEINCREYIVERSIDGNNFEKIATLSALNNSTTINNYSFMDDKFPFASKLFYRLVQVDLNAATKLSSVKTVVIPSANENWFNINKVVPMPVRDIASVEINAYRAESVQLRVLDILGNQVYKRKQLLKAGNNVVLLDMSNYRNGLYLVEVFDDKNFRVVSRIIK